VFAFIIFPFLTKSLINDDENIAIIAALIHPIFRFLYIGAYIFNIPTARGLMWASGIFTTLLLYKEGLTQLL